MRILAHGKDIFERTNYCQLCGCVFETDRDDGMVELENGISRLYVECPAIEIVEG